MRKQYALLMGILMFASSAVAQHPASESKLKMPSGHMESMDCNAMMEKMHESSKPMDDRLQALVDEMNRARGSAKVDRMADVINELTTQRKQMREHMMSMMPKMMGHMMEHMHGGMANGMKSMAGCPMMKGASTAADGEYKKKH